MDLNELKALMAASLLGGIISSAERSSQPLKTKSDADNDIAVCVRVAQRIWDETLRQDREG